MCFLRDLKYFGAKVMGVLCVFRGSSPVSQWKTHQAASASLPKLLPFSSSRDVALEHMD